MHPALAVAVVVAAFVLANPALAGTHLVKMLNRNDTGGMVFEPDYLEVAPGDTVKFLATSIGHNAASIDGFLPVEAKPFKGRINQEIEVTFAETGFYGVKCTPHYDMGMVMLIQVGSEAPSSATLPTGMPKDATKRFEQIIERAGRALAK